MRECVKVILGVLALTIGASAPSLIFEAIRPGTLVPLNTPPPSGRDAQTERDAYSTEHHGDRQTAQQNPSNPPALLDNQQSQNQDAIATHPKHQGEGNPNPEWWVAFWTCALFLTTTGLWVFTALLWWTTRRAVNEGQEAITAANTSATAATRTADAMEGTAQRQLRAYVGIKTISFEIGSDIGPDYKPVSAEARGYVHRDFIVSTAFNFGMTPAYRVSLFAYVEPTEFPDRLPVKFFADHDLDVFPAAEIRPAVTRALVQREQPETFKSPLRDIRFIQAAKDRKVYIYVYGRIYYYDAYNRPWRTKFCYVWEPWHLSGERFVPYEEYNSEDQHQLLDANGNPA
jgi:hypothetical protein